MKFSAGIQHDLSFAALIAAVVFIPFSIPLCHIAVITFITLTVFEGKWRKKIFIIRNSLLLQLFILAFAIQVAGLVNSDDLRNGFFILEKKIFLLLLPIALATTTILLSHKRVNGLFYALSAACIAASLYSLVMATQVSGDNISSDFLPPDFHLADGESKWWLVYSYIGLSGKIGLHPTFFSFYIGVSLIFLFSRFIAHRSIITLVLILLSMTFLVVILTLLSSRIVILGLVICAILTIFYQIVFNRNYFHALPPVLMLLIITAVGFLNPVSRYRNIDEFRLASFSVQRGHLYDHSADIRYSLWWLSMEAFNQVNPLTGAGTGDVMSTIKDTAEDKGILNILNTFDPHNQYLYAFLAHGIAGLAVFIMMIFLPSYLAWTERGYFMMAVIFLFAFTCITESMLEVQKGIIFYAIFLPVMSFHLFSLQYWGFRKNIPADARS